MRRTSSGEVHTRLEALRTLGANHKILWCVAASGQAGFGNAPSSSPPSSSSRNRDDAEDRRVTHTNSCTLAEGTRVSAQSGFRSRAVQRREALSRYGSRADVGCDPRAACRDREPLSSTRLATPSRSPYRATFDGVCPAHLSFAGLFSVRYAPILPGDHNGNHRVYGVEY